MIFKKILPLVLCVGGLLAVVSDTQAQEQRSRIVRTTESQPTTTTTAPTTVKRTVLSSPTTKRPTLTNEVVVVGNPQNQPNTVKKTNSSQPVIPAAVSAKAAYSSALVSRMMQSIQSKYGIPYRLGTTGPNRYDCSGFVWSVFNEAGINFTRSSARTYWAQFEPVYGEDRYKFGTLVFLNRLGHVGIVADEKGFYHASQSKGITYSPFAGYWEKRIVGFRRVPTN